MPPTARRELSIAASYDGSRLVQGIAPSKEAIKELGLELRGLKQTFATSGGDVDQYTAALNRVRDEAIQYADGLDHVSDEYARLTSLSAQATREIERQERALNAGAPEADQYANGLKSIDVQSKGLLGSLGGLQGALGAVGLAFGAQEVLQYVTGIGQMTEQAGQSRAALVALAGGAEKADGAIQAVVDATNGAVSRLEATGVAARLFSLGVANSADEAERFARVAITLGAAVGTDATESINQLQAAIANLSYERLDALGISAGRVRERVAELKEEGYSTEDAFKFATLEQAATRLNELEAAGFNAGTGTEKLAAAWDNFSLALGERFAPAYESTVVALTGGLQWLEKNIDAIEQLSFLTNVYSASGKAGIDTANAINAAWQQQASDADLAAQGNAILDTALQSVAVTLNAIPLDDTAAQNRLVADAFLETARAAGLTETQVITLWEATGGLRSELVLAGDDTRTMGGSFTEAEANGYALQDALIDAKNAALVAAGGFITAGNDALSMAGAFSSAVGFTYDLANALGALNAARAGRSSGDALDVAREQLGFAQNAYANSDSIIGRVNAYANVVEAQNKVADAEENVRNEVARTAEEIKRTAYAAKEAHDRVANAGVRGSGRVASAAKAAATEQKRALKDLEAEAKRTYDNMAGFVDQALSFQGGVGANDDLLDRTGVGRMENRSNEIIRRLEDVRDRALEGTRSQWIESFMGLDNANLEVVAANAERRIRDLQMGIFDSLTPEDREAFKADAMRLMGIQQRAQQFRDELTQELLAAGGNATQVEQAVTALLGAPSESAATGTGADIGNALLTSLDAQVKADEARYIGIGEFIGMGIKSGTLKGLEGMGVELLAQLRTEINAQIGYTG